MFSIGEFARLGGVSVRTLRHYDEIGLLRPATVDPDTGYRGYSAAQLGQLNRIMALKELGLSLTQARRLLAGVTLGELRGMLILRRAQLAHEVEEHKNQLLGVEARLRSIAREDAMPADDIVTKKIPAIGVVVIAGQAPGFGAANIVPVVNQLDAQFDQLRIHDRVKEAGPRIVFYEREHGEDITVCLALPVTEEALRRLKPFEFQNWVIAKVWGTASPRKTGDMGIDGYSFMVNDPIQVKQTDRVGRNVIDNFETAMRRVGKTTGYIIAFSFGKGAHEEVARARWDDKIMVQLITVRSLLEAKDEARGPLIPKDATISELPLSAPNGGKDVPSIEELIRSHRSAV
jgi:DNA-binding transcriptional MerR regulator